MALKDKKSLYIGVISACAAGVLAILILIGGWFYFNVSASDTDMVYIYPNTTSNALRDSLANKFGDKFADKTIMLASDFSDADWNNRVGAYKIEKGMSSFKAMRKLTHGMQTPIKLTFNNLRTIDQLAQRIGNKFLMDSAAFSKALYNKAMLKKMDCDTNNVRVIFFPDTYEFYWNITPEKLIGEFYTYYQKWWNDDRKSKADALNITPQQASIVASIVEEETNDKEERGMVARLYLNRFQQGMKLQADPTVKFALQDFTLRRISGPILYTNSPYNTYKFAGLPPGPIRLPEKATIDAVLNAPQHDYIYMCAKEDFSGRHNFTSSYDEHMANARKYQEALNKRGIK